jgi:hypothetical protein
MIEGGWDLVWGVGEGGGAPAQVLQRGAAEAARHHDRGERARGPLDALVRARARGFECDAEAFLCGPPAPALIDCSPAGSAASSQVRRATDSAAVAAGAEARESNLQTHTRMSAQACIHTRAALQVLREQKHEKLLRIIKSLTWLSFFVDQACPPHPTALPLPLPFFPPPPP